MRKNVRRIYGDEKLHLIESMFGNTICGKEFSSSEWVSMYDYPFDLCEKCWAYIGKEMADIYFNKKRWDNIVEYFDKENIS